LSAFALCFHRNGAPVSPSIIDAMLEAQSSRGGDALHRRINGGIGMGYRALWTVPEEVDERQPLVLPEAGLMVTWHGRIDNRRELLQGLGVAAPEMASWSDARLLLHLYAEQGQRAFRAIVGSFAAAVYHRPTRTLTLARDPLGHREINFHLSDKLLLAATQESGVLAHPRLSRRLNPLRLAGFFAFTGPYRGETFFQDVYKLLPGHMLTVSPTTTRDEQYWAPDILGRVRYRDPREYNEHFRELLEQAVACRRRSVGPLGVMTSGGLDSGPIAALAARQTGGGMPVYSLSWVFDRFKECDERAYLEPLWRQCGLEPVPFNCDDAAPYSDLENWPVHPDTPDQDPYRRFLDNAYKAARERNVRVLLNGGGGDALYLGGDRWCWELIAAGQARQALEGAAWFIREKGAYPFVRNILLRSLVPHTLLRRLRPYKTPAWLTDQTAMLLRQERRWPQAYLHTARPVQSLNILSLRIYDFLNAENHWCNQYDVEVRYPLLDRRIVEFMLKVPDHVLNFKGTTRAILRPAVADLLPEAHLYRQDKTVLSPVLRHGAGLAASQIRRCLDDSAAIWTRYIEKDWIKGEKAATQALRETLIWCCVAAELWRVEQNNFP